MRTVPWPHLMSNYLFLSACTLGYLFYSRDYNPTFLLYICLLNLSQFWTLGTPSDGFVCPRSCSFLRATLLSDNTNILGNSHFPYSSHGINYFSKGPWFLSLEMVLRNQDLGARYAICYRGVINFRLSW